jgi:hypothetical protein
MEILASYYGSQDYLVFTQVLLNLSHDPRTSEQTRQALIRNSEATQPPLRRLQAEVLAGTGSTRPEVGPLLFHSLRGLALSQVMLSTTIPAPSLTQVSREFPAQRKLLAEALALLIEQESAQSQPAPAPAKP